MPHPAPLTHPSRILVVAPAWIGDTLMAQPLLTRLKTRAERIDVVAPAWTAPLLKRMPEVDEVIESTFRHGEFGWSARRTLGRQLASRGYDEAIVLPNSWKSALLPWFAGIPLRTGFTGEARYGLLNRRHTLDKAALPQLVERYATLAEAPGHGPHRPIAGLHLTSTLTQQQAVRATLGLNATAPVIFCPGAEYGPAKRWPAHHFATLARLLPATTSIWILGSSKDAAVGDAIVAGAGSEPGRIINLCGHTSLEQAIDLLAGAAAVVSNDSGLMHVSAALGRPLVALYGSSSPDYTPPRSAHAKILRLGLECSPCFKRECPLGHLKCLEDITPAQVRAALDV